ncbi:phage tail tape measure protein [Planctomycetaceae bacterium SH139]
MSAVKAGAAYVELTTRNGKLRQGLRSAQRHLQDFGNSARLIGGQLLGMGTTAATPMAISAAVFANFDDAIRSVRAVTQASSRDFERLRDRAKELGASTSFSATQVANLMTELGRTGFNPSQIVEMTGAVMDLARATGTEATMASGIMAATIRQFGLQAEDATRVADSLTAAANKSFNSVESLGEALKYAAPVAADANMQLEDTLAILGSLGNMGIQGSDAGTSLRRLLTRSGAQAKKFQQVFGVATLDAAGNVRPLVDVLGDVAEATANLGTGERARRFQEVFGLLGITSASAIGKSVTNTRELYEQLVNASGAAANTAKEMDAGIGGAFRILKSAAEGVAIAFGEAIEKPLQRAAEAISGTLSAVIRWIETHHEAAKSIAKVVLTVLAVGAALVGLGVAFGAAGSIIGGFLAVLSLVGATFSAIGIVLGTLLSPLGLAIAAVVSLGVYLLHTSGVGGQALSWLGEKFNALKSTATEAFGAIGRALAAGDMAAAGRILWLTLKLEWQRGIQALEGYWLAFKEVFMNTANAMIFGVAGVISDGWAAIEVAWVETLAFLSDAWSLFASSLTKTWHATVGFIKKAWVRLRSLFDSDINVEAEVKQINKDVAAQQQATTDNMHGQISERERQRRQRRAEIEAQRQGRADILGQNQADEQTARQRAGQLALAQTAAELAATRKDWQEAVAALKDSSADADSAGSSSANRPSIKALQQALAQSSQVVAAEQQAVETKSTFNAFAIRGLGADSLSDRALRAAEATAANTKKLITAVENNGIEYS